MLAVVMCLLLLIAITMIVIMSVRRHPYLVTGWFWYLGTLVPVIGIVKVGSQSMADRYTYIPLIGIFIMIAWGIPELFEKWQFKKMMIAALTGIVIPILLVCSWVQIGYWKNSNTLFQHALNVTMNNYMAQNNLAQALIDRGDYDVALKHCAEALKINPYFAYPYNNMGFILKKRGEIPKAISYYSKAIQIDSNFVDAYNNLGSALINQGKNSEAVKQFSKAIAIKPESVFAHLNMGVALANQGRINEAIQQYHKALQIKPDSFEALYDILHDLLQRLWLSIYESLDVFSD
jgi:protein O-mannosyl-transferase